MILTFSINISTLKKLEQQMNKLHENHVSTIFKRNAVKATMSILSRKCDTMKAAKSVDQDALAVV